MEQSYLLIQSATVAIYMNPLNSLFQINLRALIIVLESLLNLHFKLYLDPDFNLTSSA